jgi:hypothetical protein
MAGEHVERLVLDLVALDQRLEDELVKYGPLKEFKVVLWRQEPDATGCNWMGRIERLDGSTSLDVSWSEVLPQLRERYNLP